MLVVPEEGGASSILTFHPFFDQVHEERSSSHSNNDRAAAVRGKDDNVVRFSFCLQAIHFRLSWGETHDITQDGYFLEHHTIKDSLPEWAVQALARELDGYQRSFRDYERML